MNGAVPLVPARPAHDAHVAFGINTHFGFQHPQDTNRFASETVDLLLQLGVGRVRQKLYCDSGRSRQATRAAVTRLHEAGVALCAPTLTIDDASSLGAARARIGAYLDEIETHPTIYDPALLAAFPGLNEPNAAGVADWAQRTRWAQQALYEGVRGRPTFDHVPVLGPPLARPGGPVVQAARASGALRRPAAGGAPPFAQVLAAQATELGDLSTWADRADLHVYPGDADALHGGPPEAFADAVSAVYGRTAERSTVPQTVTEYGWSNTSPDDPHGVDYDGRAKSCPESVTAVYAPKAPLAALLRGYDTAYAYQMLDGAPPFADHGRRQRLACFGHVRTPRLDPATWVPKAQFRAMRRFLALVADPGPVFAPVGLPMRIDGAPDLSWLLLARRDGTHVLALWRAVDLYRCDPRTNTGQYLQVVPTPARITLGCRQRLTVHRPSQELPGDPATDTDCLELSVGADLMMITIG